MAAQINFIDDNIANLVELIKFKSGQIIQILSSIEERKLFQNNVSLQSMFVQRSKEIVSLVIQRVVNKQQNEASINIFHHSNDERDDQQKVLDLVNAIRKKSKETELKVERIEWNKRCEFSARKNDQSFMEQRDEVKNQMQGNIFEFSMIKIKEQLKRFWTFIQNSVKYFI